MSSTSRTRIDILTVNGLPRKQRNYYGTVLYELYSSSCANNSCERAMKYTAHLYLKTLRYYRDI